MRSIQMGARRTQQLKEKRGRAQKLIQAGTGPELRKRRGIKRRTERLKTDNNLRKRKRTLKQEYFGSAEGVVCTGTGVGTEVNASTKVDQLSGKSVRRGTLE